MPNQRSSAENGIWLCQSCSKLIDSDEALYPVTVLTAWKTLVEHAAGASLEGRGIPFVAIPGMGKAESHAGLLLDEMADDLRADPLARTLHMGRAGQGYSTAAGEIMLCYDYERHPNLQAKLELLVNIEALQEVSTSWLRKFRMTENFVNYLLITRGSYIP